MTPRKAVSIEALRFGWGGAPVLDIPELSIGAGERVFVEGPSGCGKSTLLGLIAGVLVPNAGRVAVLGEYLDGLSARQRDRFRADHIGFVFQLFNLVPYLSVTENVTLPCRFSKLRRARALMASETVGLEAQRLLNGLGLDVAAFRDRPAVSLSIGQQQRVAAARALMGAPEVIIADEPTSALDQRSRHQFLELLFKECERRKTTLILVSHESQLALQFERHIDFGVLNRAGSDIDQ